MARALRTDAGEATLVDLTGSESRLLGVVLPKDGKTWFYKFMGNPTVVDKGKEAFIKFVQSARYPNG